MIPKLVDAEREGLFSEHAAGIAPITREVAATIRAVEALRAAGAQVKPLGDRYRITLGAVMPPNIMAVHVNEFGPCLRLKDEPEWPGEFSDYWAQVDWLPCPRCGAPVVWYEAGYVPGYRVCSQPPHHHSIAR